MELRREVISPQSKQPIHCTLVSPIPKHDRTPTGSAQPRKGECRVTIAADSHHPTAAKGHHRLIDTAPAVWCDGLLPPTSKRDEPRPQDSRHAKNAISSAE